MGQACLTMVFQTFFQSDPQDLVQDDMKDPDEKSKSNLSFGPAGDECPYGTGLILEYQVAPKDFEEGGKASSTMKRMFERFGIDTELIKRITISAYEAEMNLIIHTDEGGRISAEIKPERIVLVAQDSGPGISSVEDALRPGFSTAPDWVRSLGFGAGMGLCNIKRYSDSMSLVSEPGKGTVLTAVFDVKPKDLKDRDSTNG